MIEIIDIASNQRTEPESQFGFLSFPKYPDIEPDDVLFAYCSGFGSQGDKDNYIITYTGAVYRVSVFEFGTVAVLVSLTSDNNVIFTPFVVFRKASDNVS